MKAEKWQERCSFCKYFSDFSGCIYSPPGKGICELKTEDSAGVVFMDEKDVCDDYKFVYDKDCESEVDTIPLVLKKYLTHGGFIKDRNGRWCKDGDKVLFLDGDKVVYRGNLVWLEHKNMFQWIGTYEFELIEPCEPDICKDFEEM